MSIRLRSRSLPGKGLFASAALLLIACGGSSTGGNTIKTTLSGTAADGAPVAAASLVVKDWSGVTVETTTRADGRYVVNARKLAGPFLLRVDDGQGKRYHSVASERGTANVTLLSQLIVESLARGYDTDPDTLFADPTLFAPPSRHAIDLIEERCRAMIAPWLRERGLDPETFDLITTPFVANAAGFNALLALSDYAINTLTIDDGVKSQVSYRLKSPGDLHGFVSTLTTPDGTCSTWSESWFPVGVASPLATALDGIAATLAELRTIVNAGGAELSFDELVPLIDPSCLDHGNDQEFMAAEFATLLRGVHVDSFRVLRVLEASSDGTLVDAEFELFGRQDGRALRRLMHQRFLQDGADAPWLFAGDGQIAATSVQFARRHHAEPGGSYSWNLVDVEVRARAGVIDELWLLSNDYPPLFDEIELPLLGIRSGVLAPTPTSTLPYDELIFGTSADPTSFPPIGTEFDLSILPTGSSLPVSYHVTERGITTESLQVLAPTGHDLADALPGEQLTVTWKLPTTFVPVAITLTGECTSQGGTHRSTMGSDEPLAPTDTTGHLSFPTEHGGFPIDGATFTLEIVGASGERSIVQWHFSDFS